MITNKEELIKIVKKFPDESGVYLMRGQKREILYIGKATSLRQRVLSYFQRPQEARIEKMLSQVQKIETKQTDSVLEALLLENRLIKQYQPKYNVKLKDDKTYLGIFITKEEWPRVVPIRQSELASYPKARPQRLKLANGGLGEFYGPFPSGSQVREALQILRRLFPFRVSCEPLSGRACFEYHLGFCPGVCSGIISKEEYQATIKQIKMFLRGEKKKVINDLKRQMKTFAKKMEFEKAAKIRDRIFSLQHIQDVALVKEDDLNKLPDIPSRIEAYDISNIAGAFAVGAMVVFNEGIIDKSQYRRFKIKTVSGANDPAMIQEVLMRRFAHKEWPMPDLVLIDGGKPQVNAALEILKKVRLDIPVIGIAKGPKRDKNEFIFSTNSSKQVEIDKKLLIKVRDEAHRFAIDYYRLRHKKALMIKK